MNDQDLGRYYESIMKQLLTLRDTWGAAMLLPALGAWEQNIAWLESQGGRGAELGRNLREVMDGIARDASREYAESLQRVSASPDVTSPTGLPVPPGPLGAPARDYTSPRYATARSQEQRQRQIYSWRDRYQPPKAAQPSTPQYPIREIRREGRPFLFGTDRDLRYPRRNKQNYL